MSYFSRMAGLLQDDYDLGRFVDAQESIYDRVTRELREGRKRSHWIWFIFPQISGLGHSAMAQKYSIASVDEAKAYLAHPVLGPRLRECTQLVNAIESRDIGSIMGYPDDLKFRSSMTLFAHAAPEEAIFREALDGYFGGEEDRLTIERL